MRHFVPLQFNLAAKVVVLSVMVAAVTASIFAANDHRRIVRLARDQGTQRLESSTARVTPYISAAFEDMARDLEILREPALAADVVRGSILDKASPAERGTVPRAAHLQADMASMLAARPSYTRIRLVDTGAGMEIVADRRAGRATLLEPRAVQDASIDAWFEQALAMRDGQVAFSDVTRVAGDNGGSADPRFAIHALMPLFAPDGAVSGLLVIDQDYGSMLDRVLSEAAPSGKVSVIDSAGRYEWASEGSSSYRPSRASNTELSTAAYRPAGASDTAGTVPSSLDDEDMVFHFGDLHVGRAPFRKTLRLAVGIPSPEFYREVSDVQRETLLISAMLIGIAALTGWLMSRVLTRPIFAMKQAVIEYGRSGRLQGLPTHRSDEIGEFARSFRKVAEDLARSRKAASDSEAARLQAVLDTVQDGVITIDAEGRVETFNSAAARIFGYSPEEVIGKNVNILMPERDHGEHDNYPRNYRIAGTRRMTGSARKVSARRKDGVEFPVALSVNEMRLFDGTMFVGTVRDITDRERAEKAINRYVSALEISNRELDDFAYIASHDLKEPLRGLSKNATFLREDHQDQLGPDAHNRLARISFLCQRMERLIDELLHFSRLGRQDLALRETNLNEVVDDIRMTVETQLEERNATINVPNGLPTVICDRYRIAEVFRNLVTNALKYNKSATKTVEIGVASVRPPGAEVARDGVFYVKDNGIGIRERFHDDIFRIFKRLNDEDDASRGTGVGLTFVKKIVERHDGRVWVDSRPGEGATFYFYINSATGAGHA